MNSQTDYDQGIRNQPSTPMPMSLRDPSGNVCMVDGRVLRIVNECGISDLSAFLDSPSATAFLRTGALVETRFLDQSTASTAMSINKIGEAYRRNDGRVILEHEKVPFPSYAYEWAPEMLYAAAEQTLDFADRLLEDGLGLKDASPYNILFRGPKPIFIDILSFEQRDPSDPTWLPFAQFLRTFLLPLLVNREFGTSLDQVFMANRDGIEPEDVYKMCSSVQRLSPLFFSMVSIPTKLARTSRADSGQIYQKHREANPEKARFILQRVLRNARKKLERVAPATGRISTWSDYMSRNRYSPEYFPMKRAFVEKVLSEAKPRRVLDVGCNTGHFSELAAQRGSSVVAIDCDPVVVGNVWRNAFENRLDILPLVVNLARPTPSTGWRNSECLSFLDRANSAFDTVFMLAVIHHMLVSERIPLPEILQLAADLTNDLLVIEFIPPDDQMFKQIVRGREHLFRDLNKDLFESTSEPYFEIVKSERLDQTGRWLYLMKKRGGRRNA